MEKFPSGGVGDTQTKVMQNLEDLVIDTYNRMRHACSMKCKVSANNYDRSDIVKKEAVCLDRCVYKYMCFHDAVGKRLSKDEETFKSLLFPADALKETKSKEEKA